MRICQVLLVSFLVASAAAWGQGRANSTIISEIKVTGSVRFKSAELVSSTGLKVGEDGRDDRLKDGADLLAASGMFEDVRYRYVTTPQGMRVEYMVADVEALYPAKFDNFVWMPREELVLALEARRPLFRGEIPNAGQMFEQIAEDMRALLAERHISATVAAHPISTQDGERIIGFGFRVQGVRIPIRAMEFPGAGGDMVGVLRQTSGVKLGSDYSEGELEAFERLDLLPQYRMRGFLQAKFGTPETVLTEAESNAVAVRLPVVEGLRYELVEVQWEGNKTFTAQELAQALKVKTGRPADMVQLESDLEGIGRKYSGRGLMEARMTVLPKFDDAARTVVVLVRVSEGAQYRMGSARLEGAPEAAEKRFMELWKLAPGEPFDSEYAGKVIAGMGRLFDLRAVRVTVSQRANREAKTVDVVVRITAK